MTSQELLTLLAPLALPDIRAALSQLQQRASEQSNAAATTLVGALLTGGTGQAELATLQAALAKRDAAAGAIAVLPAPPVVP